MEDKETKRQRIYKVIMLLVLAVFITFMLTSLSLYNYFLDNDLEIGNNKEDKNKSEFEKIDRKLGMVKDKIDKYYLKDVDENKIIEGAISGYVEALGDKYSKYISAEDMKDYTSDIEGKFIGIGIYMSADTEENKIIVISPIKNSPAEEAGILPGDYITKVDGIEYTADDLSVIAAKIKGEENTKVKLEVLRDGDSFEVEVTRKTINTNPLDSKMLENNIGYIGLSSFDDGTGDEFEEKIKELKEQNMKSLIIDLRNNGGGLVNEALQILNCLVPKNSTLLITVDKNGKEEVKKSSKEPLVNVPIVVLVNENSASASEIVSGSLKDLGVAKIVGTKTFGKGVIQEVIILSDGSGLTLTVAEYFTANKNKIDGVGIEPTETVELPDSTESSYLVTEENDVQLKRAIEILK